MLHEPVVAVAAVGMWATRQRCPSEASCPQPCCRVRRSHPRARPPSACGCRVPGADGDRCRSRRQNAHVTEERRVLYPWHPWFGLTVHVQAAAERRGTITFRCSLDGQITGRWSEVPAWMFEPAACVSMRVAASPQTSWTALVALLALLRDAAGIAMQPPLLNVPVSGVGRDPCHQDRRPADEPSASTSRKTRPRNASVGAVPSSQPGTGVASSAEGCQGDRNELDGPTAARAPASREARRDRRTP